MGVKCKMVRIAFWGISLLIFSISPSVAADTKTKPAKAKQVFIPCHPLAADLSPDGKVFVTANQDYPTLSVMESSNEQKNRQIPLTKKASDVVFIDSSMVVASFGPWGELAVINLTEGSEGQPFNVGMSAEGMCKISDGRLLVIDSEAKKIHLIDPTARSVIKSFTVQSNSRPAQMRWLMPDLRIEIADAEGKVIDTLHLPKPATSRPQDDTPKK